MALAMRAKRAERDHANHGLDHTPLTHLSKQESIERVDGQGRIVLEKLLHDDMEGRAFRRRPLDLFLHAPNARADILYLLHLRPRVVPEPLD